MHALIRQNIWWIILNIMFVDCCLSFAYVCTGRRIAMTELKTILVKVLSAVVLPTILLYSARGGKYSLI